MNEDLEKFSPGALLAYMAAEGLDPSIPAGGDTNDLELVIRHTIPYDSLMFGEISNATESLIIPLTGSYALVYIARNQAMKLLSYPEVIYAELSSPFMGMERRCHAGSINRYS